MLGLYFPVAVANRNPVAFIRRSVEGLPLMEVRFSSVGGEDLRLMLFGARVAPLDLGHLDYVAAV